MTRFLHPYTEYPREQEPVTKMPVQELPHISKRTTDVTENLDDLSALLDEIHKEQQLLPQLDWIEQTISIVDVLYERASANVRTLRNTGIFDIKI